MNNAKPKIVKKPPKNVDSPVKQRLIVDDDSPKVPSEDDKLPPVAIESHDVPIFKLDKEEQKSKTPKKDWEYMNETVNFDDELSKIDKELE